ncbi:MAG: ornithine carbamoyltransferase [Acidimicrobiales bacterium]|nr:ornithine carbamoyltransferase [Acidimicrobiales bacterium]
MKHLLEIDDLSAEELGKILELARREPDPNDLPLAGQGVACYFAKQSARTRNSTEMAVVQLGGHPVYITDAEVSLGARESVSDVTHTLACYHRMICARVYGHAVLEEMASVDVVPIVNLLSDAGHPLQAIADVLTIIGEFGTIEGRVVSYVGDANNVTRSLALAVGRLGGEMRVISPAQYRFSDVDADRIAAAGVEIQWSDRAEELLPGSDVIYTDTWVSMGEEDIREAKLRQFEGFQVTADVLALAPEAIFMHCLPAHRGEEVADDVLDGPNSRIWVQAANRLRSARGVLRFLASHPNNVGWSPLS